MTKIRFFTDDNGLNGFQILGHSTANSKDDEGRIVCSAVSSAAYLVANTVLEIVKDPCDVSVNDAEMILRVEHPSPATQTVLEGLKLHLTELSKQYPKQIKIITEV